MGVGGGGEEDEEEDKDDCDGCEDEWKVKEVEVAIVRNLSRFVSESSWSD